MLTPLYSSRCRRRPSTGPNPSRRRPTRGSRRPRPKTSQIQRQALAHPDGAVGVVAALAVVGRQLGLGLGGVGVDQHGQRAAPDGQPGDEGAELGRRVHAHLEHGHRVRPDRPVPECVYAEFGEFAPDALSQGAGVFRLLRGGMCVLVVVLGKVTL